MSREKSKFPSIYEDLIQEVVNLEPKKHVEIDERTFGSFRNYLYKYQRNNTIGGRITSIRVTEKHRWFFRVPSRKKKDK